MGGRGSSSKTFYRKKLGCKGPFFQKGGKIYPRYSYVHEVNFVKQYFDKKSDVGKYIGKFDNKIQKYVK